MRITLLLIVLLAASGCVMLPDCVTSDIDGLVVDKISRLPVEGASVSSRDYPDVATVTDEDGRFFLKRKKDWVLLLPIGDRYIVNHLLVEADGYQNASTDVGGWPPCGPVETRIELEPVEPTD